MTAILAFMCALALASLVWLRWLWPVFGARSLDGSVLYGLYVGETFVGAILRRAKR